MFGEFRIGEGALVAVGWLAFTGGVSPAAGPDLYSG